jgi:hypothetical protein
MDWVNRLPRREVSFPPQAVHPVHVRPDRLVPLVPAAPAMTTATKVIPNPLLFVQIQGLGEPPGIAALPASGDLLRK